MEVARYVGQSDKAALVGDTEQAWHAYHGCAALTDAEALLEGGTAQIGEDSTCVESLTWKPQDAVGQGCGLGQGL